MASVGSGERAEQKGPRTLAELQNQAKRDPEGYRSEFSQQWRHYESNLQIFLLKPSGDAHTFGELVTFIAHLVRWSRIIFAIVYYNVCKF